MAQEGLLGGEGLRGEGRLKAGRKDTNLGALTRASSIGSRPIQKARYITIMEGEEVMTP